MVEEDQYTDQSIWVSNLVEYPQSVLPLSTVPAALISIGLIPYILTAVFFTLTEGPNEIYIISVQTLAATIAVVGPILIWHYDESVFPRFINEVDDVIKDRDTLIEVVDKYERFFVKKYWIITVLWTLLIITALIGNVGFFKSIGVSGYFDLAFLIYIVFATWWSIITGIGLHGALTTILCVRAVGNLELVIDPLHHDGLGGLSTIGYFSIRATIMNSIGSFVLPLAFSIASNGQYKILVYIAVGGYISFILATFVYPTYYVNRRAQEVRDEILKEKRTQIHQLKQDMSFGSSDGDLSELETQLKIRTLRDDFNQYQSVNLYPLSVSILTQLGSSILLPILFLLLETYIFSGA